MAKIIPFRIPQPKPPTEEERLAEMLTSNQAIDLIVIGMLEVAIPKWVENQWPFSYMEYMADELRCAMRKNVPDDVSRFQVEAMVAHLRGSWVQLIDEIDPRDLW